MNIFVSPARLTGTIPAIASKSDAHRRLILAAFADRSTTFSLNGGSDDICSTVNCLEGLGAKIEKGKNEITVIPGPEKKEAFLFANESGSTLRFLLPVAMAKCEKAHFTGAGRLPERPLTHLINAMKAGGTVFSSEKLPLTATGKMKSGVFLVPGNISSQYVTGLLMALPFLAGDSEIVVEGELASKAYVDITLETMRDFDLVVQKTPTGYFVPGGQKPKSKGRMEIEGDWSNAAFFLAAGAISDKSVTVTGLNANSPQGDKAICELLQKFGAKVEFTSGAATVSGGNLTGCVIDIDKTPDLIAPLGAVAVYAQGETVFANASRLRIKESDRIETMKKLITALGGVSSDTEDTLTVVGRGFLPGGTVDGANDHRIVMAAAIAGCFSENGARILGAQAVNKSYPGFFEDFNSAGGKANVV
ncbi:MAG: 3-phosphoshikimate 1-carboxyvinyltransferase [Clostridia bacterium]|nr:3-phosphoshikimate 1-carboxyvinyltransferase [Clostridia bacterium]